MIHQIIRTIARTGMVPPNTNAMTGTDVDAYIAQWEAQGYELFNTHYLGENPEGYTMLYVLRSVPVITSGFVQYLPEGDEVNGLSEAPRRGPGRPRKKPSVLDSISVPA
jgi:hypothetical protein